MSFRDLSLLNSHLSSLMAWFEQTELIHEVFKTILRGLSGAEVTKLGKFRSCQDGYAVKS